MTVKELKEKLDKIPDEYPVYCRFEHVAGWHSLDVVETYDVNQKDGSEYHAVMVYNSFD